MVASKAFMLLAYAFSLLQAWKLTGKALNNFLSFFSEMVLIFVLYFFRAFW
jgi:hypothetical protein